MNLLFQNFRKSYLTPIFEEPAEEPGSKALILSAVVDQEKLYTVSFPESRFQEFVDSPLFTKKQKIHP